MKELEQAAMILIKHVYLIVTGREHVDGDNASRLRKILELIKKFDEDF